MPTALAPYAKGIIAAAVAALETAQAVIPMSASAHGWVAVALAGLGAAGVYLVPNAPMPAAAPVQLAAALEPPAVTVTGGLVLPTGRDIRADLLAYQQEGNRRDNDTP